MSLAPFMFFNGDVISSETPVYTASNRTSQFGDGLFESMRMGNGRLLWAEDHFARIRLGADIIHLQHPLLQDEMKLSEMMRVLEKKNALGGNARVRMQLSRINGRGYVPDGKTSDLIILMESVDHPGYQLNPAGLRMGIYRDQVKTFNKVSQLKTSSALLNVLASAFAVNSQMDDCLLLNANGRIAEGSASNVFLVKDNKVFTPPLTEACVDGIMRKQIIRLCTETGIPFKEIPIDPMDLHQADEVFFTNAVQGIRWVGAFETKRYYHTFSSKLLDLLNAQIN